MTPRIVVMNAATRRLSIGLLAFGILAVGLMNEANAIQPQHWVHTTEADFEAGELESVVVTNLGDIKLAAAAEAVGELPEGVSLIYDMQTLGDTTYLAAGPEAKLLAMKDGEITEVASFEKSQVFALDAINGQLLLGISGEKTRLAVWHEDKAVDVVTLNEDKFIWDIAVVDGDALLATGPEGKVHFVMDVAGYAKAVAAGNRDEPPAVAEILDTSQANVLCLATGPGGVVYAGTDTEGLVYRMTPKGDANYDIYVIYDAAEPEIGALLVASDGTVYAGTADAEQARPGRIAEPADQESGRPQVEGDASEITVDGEPGETPELPIDPDPQPLQNAPAEMDAATDAADSNNATDSATDAADTDANDADANDSATDTASAEPGKPTPQQYDAVREEIRKRLLAARKSGKLGAGSGSSSKPRPTRAARGSGDGPSASPEGGNAVYRIDAKGFVSEVFRESVMILNIAQRADGKLLVATGNEGQLYLVDPTAGETSVLIDLEPQQLLAIQINKSEAGGEGVLIAGSNPALLTELATATATRGVYTSDVLDAAQVSLWGAFHLTAELPGDTSVTVETRSGNVADPEAAGWAEWSQASVLTADADRSDLEPREIKIASPPARFLQYRLTLTGTAEPATTPAVGKVSLAYVSPNQRPRITSLTAAYPEFPGIGNPASPSMSVNWEAADANGDRLLYDLQFQPASAPGKAAGNGKWLTLAEDFDATSFEWDTRKAPEGWFRLRITATDKLDNPGKMALASTRLADPVLVDNTAPVVESMKSTVNGKSATLTATVADDHSPIHSVAYTLDDDEQFSPALPGDLIYDSTSEDVSFTLSNLSPGGHTVTVRVIDTRGNTAYTSKIIQVKP